MSSIMPLLRTSRKLLSGVVLVSLCTALPEAGMAGGEDWTYDEFAEYPYEEEAAHEVHSPKTPFEVNAKKVLIKPVNSSTPKKDAPPRQSPLGLRCEVTPAIDPTFIPLKAINKSSNLLRKAGSPNRARGQYIQLTGKVVGEDCIPVSNAVVQIWQTDSVGKYDANYTTNSEWDVKDKDYDPHFAYSGTALTNNAGEFVFLTILPGVMEGRAPHINMSVSQSRFDGVTTKVFFAKHPRNSEDPDLQALDARQRPRVKAQGQKIDPSGQLEGRVYDMTITLGGIHKYKRY